MPLPTAFRNRSIQEIREEILRLIEFLERTKAQHPRWSWPAPVLVFAREFQALAAQQPLDLARVRDFKRRLQEHIRSHRLKGFQPWIWDAEALEHLAETPPLVAKLGFEGA
jgi:hypothetical protein